jgi:transcription elongation factor
MDFRDQRKRRSRRPRQFPSFEPVAACAYGSGAANFATGISSANADAAEPGFHGGKTPGKILSAGRKAPFDGQAERDTRGGMPGPCRERLSGEGGRREGTKTKPITDSATQHNFPRTTHSGQSGWPEKEKRKYFIFHVDLKRI